MMKFGCCLNMIGSKEDQGTGIGYIEALAEAGYDYVELPLAEMTALSEEEFEKLRGRIRDSRISCEVCNNFFPKTMRLTGHNTDKPQIISYVEKALDRAKLLGVEYVVFGSGPAKNVPEDYPLKDGYRQVKALLKDINEMAGSRGITVVIEPLRSEECNLIHTFEEGCRLADDVNGEFIRVLVDYYHMTTEQEPAGNIARLGKKYLRHVHIANPDGRVYPKNARESDYAAFFRALKDAQYDGRISCEAYTGDFAKDAQKALDFFKSMIR